MQLVYQLLSRCFIEIKKYPLTCDHERVFNLKVPTVRTSDEWDFKPIHGRRNEVEFPVDIGKFNRLEKTRNLWDI